MTLRQELESILLHHRPLRTGKYWGCSCAGGMIRAEIDRFVDYHEWARHVVRELEKTNATD